MTKASQHHHWISPINAGGGARKRWQHPSAARPARIAGSALCGFLVLLSGLAFAQGGVVNSTKNPLQVALMQWNKQDQPPAFGLYGYGISNLVAVAFDGANIWVADLPEVNGYNVTEIRASDGTLLGTFAVGSLPGGVAFDGWQTSG